MEDCRKALLICQGNLRYSSLALQIGRVSGLAMKWLVDCRGPGAQAVFPSQHQSNHKRSLFSVLLLCRTHPPKMWGVWEYFCLRVWGFFYFMVYPFLYWNYYWSVSLEHVFSSLPFWIMYFTCFMRRRWSFNTNDSSSAFSCFPPYL